MKTKQPDNLTAISVFCASHNIEISFINSLEESGMIEIHNIKETEFIDTDQIHQLEKFIHLYYDLDINLEGIDTISHLLQRIDSMQHEIVAIRNRLRFYEPYE